MAHVNRAGLIACAGVLAGAVLWGGWPSPLRTSLTASQTAAASLRVTSNDATGALTVTRTGRRAPILMHRAPTTSEPFVATVAAPEGTQVVSPALDGRGIAFAIGTVNGIDSAPASTSRWQRRSTTVLGASGSEVRWQTVYDLSDAAGNVLLVDTRRWTMREKDGRFEIDLEWRGEARVDVTLASDAGLRVALAKGNGSAEVVNAARQRDQRASGQRAMWIDAALAAPASAPRHHVALFDHPDNTSYPRAWRVDATAISTAPSSSTPWTIKRGETEVVRHRIVIYDGPLDDVKLTAAWSDYSGNRSTYATQALWALAQREGREEKFLTPAQAAAAMTTIEGFEVKAWAGEPMVQQPMAFCWDDRGRLWIAENLDYETRGRGFSGSGKSRITILEDTDRDGTADSRKVFMDGIVFPSAIAVGFDGVYVAAPPHLLFIPDRDRDDKADVADIRILLTGWGIRDRHEVVNSLHWGPDGWIYGLQGLFTSSKIRKPAPGARLYKAGEPFPENILDGEGVEIDGGVWRYHPTKDRFEVVAHGFSNPWGIDYDAKGQLLMSACVIPHLWHVVPGGVYHRQGGQHLNPYVYSDIQTIADHRHRSAHGGARVYQSDAFPASQRGRVFMANIHEHAVLSDVLERRGSGFSAKHGDDFAMANNAQWVGFSLEIGPDGALYVLDWHDADICGADVHQHETGRVFRIAPTVSSAEAWPGRYSDLSAMRDAQLVALQRSASDWHARRARVILQGRSAKRTLEPGTHEGLREIFRGDSNGDFRLRAMWGLHVTGGWAPEALAETLGDRDEYVRGWAVQLLTEDRTASPALVARFARMAREDRSPVVRLYLASALQRLAPESRWAVADGLLSHGVDAGDHNLPKMVWFGVEPLVAANPARALELAGGGTLPLVAQFVARRAVDADAVEPVVTAIAAAPKFQAEMLEGMRDGLEGRVDLAAPPSWPATLARLRRSPDARVASLAADVAGRFGDTETARLSLAAVRDVTAPIDGRRQALQMLAARHRPELVPELVTILERQDDPLTIDAIRAVAAFDDDRLGRLLVARYPAMSAAAKAEAMQTFASRGRYGRMLTDALEQKQIPKSDVPPHLARQLRRVVGVRFADVWGPVDQVATEERAYARYRGVLNDKAMAAANPVNGRVVFERTCGSCHKMHGEGGTFGPDLTGSNRANLDYLLANVINPSSDVPDAYRMVVVTLRDGRIHTGSVATETDRQLTLRVVGGEPVVLAKADVQSREVATTSMMPPGLFDTLEEREVIDLVAFLRTVQPVRR